jgi:ribonucleoside-diphosphate reductase alpha chain
VNKPETALIFKFPQKSPESSITRTEKTALEQLELWMIYKEHYCDHNPSCTINVKEHEWLEVGAWVYANFDNISGLAFLPFSEHSYTQAPYQECTKSEYEELKKIIPDTVDWEGLSQFESDDNTSGSQELACVSGNCTI